MDRLENHYPLMFSLYDNNHHLEVIPTSFHIFYPNPAF